jgi:hypothetical protein
MNAEQFYQEFKRSLDHLGVRWGDMAQVEVWVDFDTFYMMLDGRQTSLSLLLDSSDAKEKS